MVQCLKDVEEEMASYKGNGMQVAKALKKKMAA
jgi:hypothetical protein